MNKRTIAIAIAIFLAGGLGTAVGSAGAAEPVTLTKTNTVQGPERVVTKTVTKDVTPQACLDALDSAQTVIEAVAAEHTAFGAAAAKAGANGDVTGFLTSMRIALEDMNKVVTEQTDPMRIAAQACRAAS